MPSNFQIKRAYEYPSPSDGYRILVDRLWPRGVKKENLELHEWNKQIAPSTYLRKSFRHEPSRFHAFAQAYKKELLEQEDELKRIKEISQEQKVTLIYAAKDPEINHAIVLKDVLENI